jgi:tRNA(Arg) A34 adenosine deaminase TadA
MAQHEDLIRECYRLAASAVRAGNHPFGALLARDGDILLRAENSVRTEDDPTRHAELNLVQLAIRTLGQDAVRQAVLYTSTEPCVMCVGAIYWAEVPTVVYGCSAEGLGRIAGGSLLVPCRDTLARGRRATTVIGPVLEEEGLEIHRSFWGVLAP